MHAETSPHRPPAETRLPLSVIAGTRPPAGDPGCQCLPATPTVDAAHCDNCAAEGDDEASLIPPSERRAQLLGEISVTVENQLRAMGHAAAADEILGIMRELANDGSGR